MADREPCVSGRFYPADPTQLQQEIAAYMDAVAESVVPAPAQVAAIVVPHAGYPFSGPTAAYGYQRVRGKQPQRVILLGRSHHYYFEGGRIDAHEAWRTPLGRAPIDTDFVKNMLHQPLVDKLAEVHEEEHTLEVQAPFLQHILGDVPIVPILFGCDPTTWHIDFGEYLAEALTPGDLVIASTDLSHFHSQEEAEQLDQTSLKILLSQDMQRVCDAAPGGDCSMCGATAVVVAMAYALKRQATHWRLLDYATSGARSGMYDRVVGYAAVSMEWAA